MASAFWWQIVTCQRLHFFDWVDLLCVFILWPGVAWPDHIVFFIVKLLCVYMNAWDVLVALFGKIKNCTLDIRKFHSQYTGCIKKKVIELQRAIVSELLCIWTRFFHIRKDHAFSCWMISSSCQMDKKWANTNPIKNVSQNRIFSPLRVGSKTIENEPPLVLKLMNFTSLNYAHIHNYY
jgi:hypothetical protein